MMGMPSVPSPGHSGMAPTFKPSLPAMRFIFSNTTLYLAIFLAGAIVSLSTPRNLLLQYIPNAYTSGVLSAGRVLPFSALRRSFSRTS